MTDSTERRLTALEKSHGRVADAMTKLTVEVAEFRGDVRNLIATMSKHSEVPVQIARLQEQTNENRADINRAFAKVRDMNEKGTDKCGPCEQRITNLESYQKWGLGILAVVIAGLILAVLNILFGGGA